MDNYLDADGVRSLLKAKVAECGGQQAAADVLGVDCGILNKVLNGRLPTPKVVEALGLEARTIYVFRKGTRKSRRYGAQR